MPGVIVETGFDAGGAQVDAVPGETYFVAGLTERGDTVNAVLVRSMSEYAEKLGARVTYGAIYDDLAAFFAEGGARAYVARVVGGAATVGTLTLNDRAGTPAATLRLDALNAGAWSSRVIVQVDDGAVDDTFKITVLFDGQIVETYGDLASPAAAVTAINAASTYVAATNLGSATAAPDNNPAVVAATALSAGADDRASVIAGDLTTAANARFTRDLGPGVIAFPGYAAGTVGAGLKAHAKTNRRIALLAPAVGQSVSQARAANAALRSTDAEYYSFEYPWVQTPDGAGGVRTISPEGFRAGRRAATLRAYGPWRAPAGAVGEAQYVAGVEKTLTRAEIDSLTDDAVNTIRVINGVPRLYGWRSGSLDVNRRFLTGTDVLNIVAHQAEQTLEKYVLRTVDARGLLLAEMAGDLRDILEPMRAAGGLYERVSAAGDIVDPGYVIDTGPSVNPPSQLALGEVSAEVAVRVSPLAELIRLKVTKVAFDAPLAA